MPYLLLLTLIILVMETLQKEPFQPKLLGSLGVSRPDHPVDLDGDGQSDFPRGDRTENEFLYPPKDDDSGVVSDGSVNQGDVQTQDDVNQDKTDSKLSTDISSLFGEYSDIYADIISQMESLFGLGRYTADEVNDSRGGRDSNVFLQWLRAISGIADKIGDGTEQTNLTNALNQSMSFYMQQLSAAMQNQFNIQQWQIQNEYNSPAEQLKRLSSAGLNPLHFFNSSTTGSSTSVTASSGSSPSPAAAALGKTKSERVLGGLSSALGIAGEVSGAALAGKQVAMQAAKLPGEVTKQALENIALEEQAGLTRAEVQKTRQETANLAQQFGFNPELVRGQLHSMWAEIRLKEADTGKTWEERDALSLQKETFVQALRIQGERWLDEHNINVQQLENLKKNYAVLSEQAKSIRSATDLTEFRNDIQKRYGIPADSDVSYILAVKLANGDYTRHEFNLLVTALQELKTESGNMNLNEFLGTLGSSVTNKLLDLIGGPNGEYNDVKTYEKQAGEIERASKMLLKAIEAKGSPSQNAILP